jgi:hypothetical protein
MRDLLLAVAAKMAAEEKLGQKKGFANRLFPGQSHIHPTAPR